MRPEKGEKIVTTIKIEEKFVASTCVARQFLDIAQADAPPKPLTLLQLIKLTYIAHGWSFVNLPKPLVSEDAYAWRYGPVFPDLYIALRQFGSRPVTEVPKSSRELKSGVELEQLEVDLIKEVYDEYSNFSGVELMRMTHREETPWHKTWQISQNGVVIGNDLIREYYVNLARSIE